MAAKLATGSRNGRSPGGGPESRLWAAVVGRVPGRTNSPARRKVQQPRARRACVGELSQIDGCEHRWFEDRGAICVALVYVDDATSRLMIVRFTGVESTFAYFEATREYLERYGKPMAFYSDAHVEKTVHDAPSAAPALDLPNGRPWRGWFQNSCGLHSVHRVSR
jgi:hypothetical protein